MANNPFNRARRQIEQGDAEEEDYSASTAGISPNSLPTPTINTGDRTQMPERALLRQDYFSYPVSSSSSVALTPRPDQTEAPTWHIPDYRQEQPAPQYHLPYSAPIDNDRENRSTGDQADMAELRRDSSATDETFLDPPNSRATEGELDRFSLSSYEHPYEILRPDPVHIPDDTTQRALPGTPVPPLLGEDPNESNVSTPANPGSKIQRRVSFAEEPYYEPSMDHPGDEVLDPQTERALKRRGIPSNIMTLQALDAIEAKTDPEKMAGLGKNGSFDGYSFARTRPRLERADSSFTSVGSELIDPDDPRITGITATHLDDPEDIERSTLKSMNYRDRRKHLMRTRIEFNVSSMIHRQGFLRKLAKALMLYGAPSHRIESQLIAAARILEVESEFIHLPGVIICSFGDQELGCSQTHFVRCNGRILALGALHKIHLIYRSVVHDEISAKKASDELEAVLNEPPAYSVFFRCVLSFFLSALICPLAFGGSFLDMWFSGLSAFFLAILKLHVAARSAIYANVFEITVAIIVSFVARALSSIRSQVFCYTAISSAGIIGILPGYLILSSSLELASKNIVCGSVNLVYALIYTLFLGFGLQIGSDFYLLLDKGARAHLHSLASSLTTTVAASGTWQSDNATDDGFDFSAGTWVFTRKVPNAQHNLVDGCFRPSVFPWYLQPFPYWTAFIIVPIFSTLMSLSNLQPFKSRQLPVMIVISCCSYAANKVANHYIFNRSDVVSAIGAFTVGLLGNAYSRKMGGTAFTSMVPGVLFLVPSGLSQAGGITANGNGIDIGGAMIAVTIGITVGLFMSQALVYTFGTRKNAAVFSF